MLSSLFILSVLTFLWCCRCAVWACCNCTAKFTSCTHLRLHLLLHTSTTTTSTTTNGRKHHQEICFLCNYPMNAHLVELPPLRENVFLCYYCDGEFSDKTMLEVHIKLEHGRHVYGNENLSWYACDICCGKLYMRSQDIVKHMKLVHQEEYSRSENYLVSTIEHVMYPCKDCGKPSILSKLCSKHKKNKLLNRTVAKRKQKRCRQSDDFVDHICWYCQQSFQVKEYLEVHIKLTHGQVVHGNTDLVWYCCNICCDRLYMRSQDIVKHMRNVHEQVRIQTNDFIVRSQSDVTWTCAQCDKICILSKTCEDHKEKIKEERSTESYDELSSVPSECEQHEYLLQCHSCQCCDCLFDECNHLWSHMFSEHKTKRKICNLCSNVDVTIKSATFLTKHMNKVHRKSLKLQITPRNDDLKEKSRIVVDGTEMYKCPECGALLKNIWSLREHIMIHTGEKPHVCDVCSKSFRNRGKLNVHCKRVHEQVREHQCGYCGRAFSDKSNLNVHIRTHTDEKKYMCELCGADFAQWATLYNHKFTHNNVKFKCTFCEKVYNNPSNLQRHIKTHTDNSLYICEVCGKDFGTARYLKRHKDTHNSVNAFVCEVCNAGFKIKKHLTQHYKTHSIFFPPEQYSLMNPKANTCERTLYKL